MTDCTAISAHRRRELARQARTLKPLLQIGRAGLTDGIIAQARTLLQRHQLIKARLPADARGAVREMAGELAAKIPCELVGLTGCVAVLYSPSADRPGEDAPAAE